MEEKNYISEQVRKLYEFVQEGHTGPEIIPLLCNIEYLVEKKSQLDKTIDDPNRLQPFGTPEEDNSKGFGSM